VFILPGASNWSIRQVYFQSHILCPRFLVIIFLFLSARKTFPLSSLNYFLLPGNTNWSALQFNFVCQLGLSSALRFPSSQFPSHFSSHFPWHFPHVFLFPQPRPLSLSTEISAKSGRSGGECSLVEWFSMDAGKFLPFSL